MFFGDCRVVIRTRYRGCRLGYRAKGMDRYIPGPHSREVTIRRDAAPIYYLQPVAEHRSVVPVGPCHDAGQALYGYQAQQIQRKLDIQMIDRRVHEPFLSQLGKGVDDPDALALVARQGKPDFAPQHGHVRLFQRLMTDAMSAAEHSSRAACGPSSPRLGRSHSCRSRHTDRTALRSVPSRATQ